MYYKLKLLRSALFFIVLIISGGFTSSANTQTLLAIPELDATGIDSASQHQIELFICENLAKQTMLQIVSPQETRIACSDSAIELHPLAIRSQIPVIMRTLKINYILLGQVGKIGELFTINIELFDSTSQSIYRTKGSYEGSIELFLVNTLEPLINEISDFISRPDSTSTPDISMSAHGKAWYKKWWVWTGVGGTAIITGAILLSGDSEQPGIEKSKKLANPPDLPDNP